ncbi:MAG: FAD-dependent oxidoreductase [Verrucomicrobiales bacterium]
MDESSDAPSRRPTDAFPVLTKREIEAVSKLGPAQSFEPGDLLFEAGQREFDCHVVLTGEVEIIDTTGDSPRLVTTHLPGEFTGDVDLLRGRPALVRARAKTPVSTIRLSRTAVREALVRVPSVGDKFVTAFHRRRQLLEESGFEGLRVFGQRDDPKTLQLREFLHRNGVLHRWLDSADPAHLETLERLDCAQPRFPVLACSRHVIYQQPTLTEIAEDVGIQRVISRDIYDTVIIGAGPSGLGAAVYAASEGLSTLVLDSVGPGGQAGSSSKIENYAGFPSGISGRELALRSQLQAMKFGAEITAPCSALRLSCDHQSIHEIETCLGTTVRTRTIIISTGVSYRQLDIPGLDQFRGRGVYHAATKIESVLCEELPIHIVGAGNSAGQAAMFLSQCSERVNLIVRGGNLTKSMSEYLSSRVLANPNIQVLFHTEVTGVTGREMLEQVTLRNHAEDRTWEEATAGLFIFIGAKPATDFLGGRVARDERGFILTGPQVMEADLWPLPGRTPCALETSCPGVFASGDCRSGTTKRVAFAIGDGALAVSCVHDFLGTYS